MKPPKAHFKRWLQSAVFAIWTGFLVTLLATQRYVAFLRPEFGILLAMASCIAMGFMLAAVIHPKTEEMDTSAVLRLLVLLVPVFYFVAMPDVILGDQAFKKRFVGTNNGAIRQQKQSMPISEETENNPNPAAAPGETEGAPQETPLALTILDIYRNPEPYKGKRVVVTGMMMHDEQLKPHFGGRDTAVYRFMINCCAADALPMAIALDSDQADAFANDQWVQVDGIFDLQQINGRPVPIVSNPQIKPVEAPADPYLY